MQIDLKAPKVVTIILDRQKGKKLIKYLNEKMFFLHSAFLGRGTAPTEFQGYFGLEPEKVLVLLFTHEHRIPELFEGLTEEFDIGGAGGFAFTVPINSASNLEVIKFILGLN